MAALCNMQLEGKRGQGFCSVVLVCSLYLQGDSLSPTFGVFLGPALGLIKLPVSGYCNSRGYLFSSLRRSTSSAGNVSRPLSRNLLCRLGSLGDCLLNDFVVFKRLVSSFDFLFYCLVSILFFFLFEGDGIANNNVRYNNGWNLLILLRIER